MKGFATLLTTLAIICPATIYAQDSYLTDNGVWRVLESNEFYNTKDWDRLRSEILKLWGGVPPVSLSRLELRPLGEPGAPPNFEVVDAAMAVIHLEKAPANDRAWTALTQLFDDVTPADIKDYRDGVRVEALRILPDEMEVNIQFLGRAQPPVPVISVGIDRAIFDAIGNQMEPRADDAGVAAVLPVEYYLGDVDDAAIIVDDLLQERGFNIVASSPSATSRQTLGLTDTQTIVVTLLQIEPGVVQVSIIAP